MSDQAAQPPKAPAPVPKPLTALEPEQLDTTNLQNWSAPVPTKRRSLLITTTIIIGVVFGLGGYWSATAKIGGALVASGQIVAEGENWVVQHLEGGIMTDLVVREGDVVERGAAVATLDQTVTRSQLQNAWIDRAIHNIELQRWRAERDDMETFEVVEAKLAPVADNERVIEALESQLNEFKSARAARLQQMSVLNNRISNEEEDMSYLADLQTSLDEQKKLIDGEYQALSDLQEKGLVSRARIFPLQRELSRLEAQKSNAIVTVQKSRHNIRSLNDSKDQLLSEHAERTSQEITRVQQALNDVSDLVIRLEDQLQRSDIVAPVSGTVLRLPIKSIGAVIKSGETVAEILPKDAELQLDVPVQPQDISKVYPGQVVDIVFPSDQADIVPPLKGEVTYVSADTLVDQSTGLSFYSVRVDMIGDPLGRSILPGNVADAFFQTEAKTLVQYMADPITRFAAKSFTD